MTPTVPADTSWLHEFRPNGAFHAATLLWCGLLIALFIVLGKRFGANTPAEKRLRFFMGWAAVAVQSAALLIRPFDGPAGHPAFDIADDLPLQVCRITGWTAALVMLTMHPLARSINLFWGLGLGSMAFVTPVVKDGLLGWEYWIFWIAHVQIAGASLYDLAVHDYSPRFRDYRNVALAALAYAAFIIPFNHVFNVDYGFMGPGTRDPSVYGPGTLAGHLGDYPWRILNTVLAAQAFFLVFYLGSCAVRKTKEALRARVAAEGTPA